MHGRIRFANGEDRSRQHDVERPAVRGGRRGVARVVTKEHLIGRELGEYALANYTEVKTVTMAM